MTDRELLELAAKAAGIEYGQKKAADGNYHLYLGPPSGWWNPLTDDGDALRLAVKLNIHITSSVTDAWATTLLVTAIEPMDSDKYAATRRAIVRAAAELGFQDKGESV
jgi:hypothetical protein